MARQEDRIQLSRLSLRGFKSIRHLEDFRPGRLNVLIGANGAGKSNLISFFRMLSFAVSKPGGGLSTYVGTQNGAHNLLFDGPAVTTSLGAELELSSSKGTNEYSFELAYAAADTLVYLEERYRFTRQEIPQPPKWTELGAGHREPRLEAAATGDKTAKLISSFLNRIKVFQFHNTSFTSRLRQAAKVTNNLYLTEDGGNLPAFLLGLAERFPDHYRRLVQHISLSLPFFEDFVLEPEGDAILLRWREKGSPELFDASQASDGMLRFLALMALLLQPSEKMQDVIFLDEPELGLHPQAIEIVGGLLREAATQVQIFVATQSVALLDQFEPEAVVVVERKGRETTFARLDPTQLEQWLEEYSLSELWRMNIFGGRPR